MMTRRNRSLTRLLLRSMTVTLSGMFGELGGHGIAGTQSGS